MRDKELRESFAKEWRSTDAKLEAIHQRIDATQLEIKALVEHLGLEWEKGLRLKRKGSASAIDAMASCREAYGLPPGRVRDVGERGTERKEDGDVKGS